MTEIDQLKKQLQQQEKLASLGMLSAGIAHEIRNPLNFVINFSKMSERLLGDLEDIVEDNAKLMPEADREDLSDIMDNLKKNLQQIAENGDRAVSIIQNILLMSRGKENECIPSDVCRIVNEYVRLSYHAMRANHHGFNVTLHETYYSPEISISVTTEANNLVITIADNGEGMTDEVKQHLFENFFTTKPIGHGTGLGMSITRDIIENKHNGKVTFTSTLGEGTSFTFTIPVTK